MGAGLAAASIARADDEKTNEIPNEKYADMGDHSVAADDGIRRDSIGVCIMDDWLGTAPEFADEDIDEELTADIVVVGGGLAGVSAARAACEAGAQVILFEKCDALQCRHGEYAAIGSKFYEEHWGRGNDDLKLEIVDSLMKTSGQRANHRILNTWADNCGAAYDWFVGALDDPVVLSTSTEVAEEGVEQWIQPRCLPAPEGYDPAKENYRCYFECTSQFYPDQSFAFNAHAQKAADTGLLTTYLATPVKCLIREEGGPVTGVVAQDYDGKTYRATAKAVILAAGDYASNNDMRNYYDPWLRNNGNILYTSVDPEGNMANTGDGDKMGMWVGAKMEEGPHAAQTHNTGGVLGTTPFLEIDLHGNRFGNEDIAPQELDNRLHGLYKNMCYQIFDAAWPEEVEKMATVNHCRASYIISKEDSERNYWLQPSFGYAYASMADEAVEAGKCLRADTVEELVDQLDLDDEGKRNALAAIEKYNEAAKAGVDEEFGKNPERMFALENPPFYACTFDLESILPIMSGLETDEQYRVLDNDREPIAGLYAAGNNGGGRFSGEYPTTIPGISHSLALTSGMLAGQIAAEAVQQA